MNRIFIILFSLLLATLPLSGCKGMVKGSGELKTRDFTRSDFSEVSADDGFDIKIIYAASYNITITADDNLFEHIQVAKKGDTLKLSLARAEYIDTTARAVITMPHLRRLSLSGGSKAFVANFNTRAGVDFRLSGESALATTNLTVGDLALDVADASKATGNLTAGDFRLKAQGGSTVQLGGAANDLSFEAGDASLLKLEAFSVRNAVIKMSGESTAAVRLAGKLDVDLKKSSRLVYYGDPILGETSISGGSTMTRK